MSEQTATPTQAEPQSETRISAQEFLQYPESNQIIELIHGEVFMSPSPFINHQDVVGRIYRLIGDMVPDGIVLIAPSDVHLDEFNVVQPDVFWVAGQNTACVPVEGKYYQGPPDLCVEVLSDGTARRDKSVKFLLYEQAGVPEYWIADPHNQTLEIWVLKEGKYARQGIYDPQQHFESPILGGQKLEVGAVFGSKATG